MTVRLVPATYASPQAALAAAASVDTIRITSGSYAGQNLNGSAAKSSIHWEWSDNVTITLAAGGYMDVGNGWTMAPQAGFETKRFAFRCADGIAINLPGTGQTRSITITGVDFQRNSGTGALLSAENASGFTSTITVSAGCTFTGLGTGLVTDLAIETKLNVGRATVTGCTFSGFTAALKQSSNQAASYLRSDRCTFNCRGHWAAQTGGAEIKSMLDVVYGCTYGFEYNSSSTAAVVKVYRTTYDCSTAAFLRTTAHSNANVDVRGCWGDTMGRVDGGSGTFDYNGYRVLAVGPAGANDVVTLADPGFVNKAANDYHLLVTSSLVDQGDGTLSVGATDHYGAPTPSGAGPDIGAAEYQATDCGITGITQTDRQHYTVTFAAAPSGPQAPLKASAETPANWGLTPTPTDATLAVLTATRTSAYVYAVALTHRAAQGTSLLFDSSAIATDTGGLCDQTGTYAITVAGDHYVDEAAPASVTYAASPKGELIEV